MHGARNIMHGARNFSIRKIQSFHDVILLGYLLYFLHVDIIPTEIILIGGSFYLIWKSADIKQRHEKINSELIEQISSYLRPPRTYAFYESARGDDSSSALSLIYKSYIFLDSSISKRNELSADALCTIEHEMAHAKRNDSVVTYLYETASKYLIFIMMLAPVTYIFTDKSMMPAGGSFLIFALYVLFENGPSIYLFLSRKNYLHRREYIADAIANESDPERYSNFLKDRAIEERRFEKFSAEGHRANFDFDPHPSFQSRIDFIQGQQKSPISSIFVFCLVAGLFSIYAFLGFGTSLVNTANASYTSSFVKSFIGLSLLYVYLNNMFEIISIVANFRYNGLSTMDKLLGTGALMFGLLVVAFLLAFIPVFGNVETNINVVLVIACLYWLVAIYPVLLIFTSSIFFSELRFKFITGLVGIGIGYTIFDVLREHLSAYGANYIQTLNLVALILLPLAVAPVVEGIARIISFAFRRSYQLVRRGWIQN